MTVTKALEVKVQVEALVANLEEVSFVREQRKHRLNDRLHSRYPVTSRSDFMTLMPSEGLCDSVVPVDHVQTECSALMSSRRPIEQPTDFSSVAKLRFQVVEVH